MKLLDLSSDVMGAKKCFTLRLGEKKKYQNFEYFRG